MSEWVKAYYLMTDVCGGPIFRMWGCARRNWRNNRTAHMRTDLTGSRARLAEAQVTDYFHQARSACLDSNALQLFRKRFDERLLSADHTKGQRSLGRLLKKAEPWLLLLRCDPNHLWEDCLFLQVLVLLEELELYWMVDMTELILGHIRTLVFRVCLFGTAQRRELYHEEQSLSGCVKLQLIGWKLKAVKKNLWIGSSEKCFRKRSDRNDRGLKHHLEVVKRDERFRYKWLLLLLNTQCVWEQYQSHESCTLCVYSYELCTYSVAFIIWNNSSQRYEVSSRVILCEFHPRLLFLNSNPANLIQISGQCLCSVTEFSISGMMGLNISSAQQARILMRSLLIQCVNIKCHSDDT